MEELTAFSDLFRNAFGIDNYGRLTKALNEPSPVSIRLNPQKLLHEVPSIQGGSLLRPIPWAEDGFYVSGCRPTFGADPFWHAGGYYVQEPGSMFVSAFLRTSGIEPMVALDLCAAPGGKSTLLRSILPPDCLLIANEPDSGRAGILKENILRFGADETIVTSAYPQNLASTGLTVDLILVDAPCSGEGMFRKEENAVQDWSLANVTMCKERQRSILDEAWKMLRPGGLLIYSTCTYNLDENDHQLQYLMDRFQLEVVHPEVPEGCEVLVQNGVYRFIPGRVDSEGFTAFAVVKQESVSDSHHLAHRGDKVTIPRELAEILGDKKACVYHYADGWYYLSPMGATLLKSFEKTKGVRVLLGGVPLGEVKGNDFIPHQGWVCSPILSHLMPYPHVDLDIEQALDYLKREAIRLESYKGIQMVAYRGLPIGLVKNLGNRVNTLYPKEMAVKNRNLRVGDVPDWKGELKTLG